MDVIKAVEYFNYYNSFTGRSRPEWRRWRIKAVEEWGLAESMLEKDDAVEHELKSLLEKTGQKIEVIGMGEDGNAAERSMLFGDYRAVKRTLEMLEEEI